MKAYNVYDAEGNEIDTVFMCDNSDAEEVRRSLINHDGYDPDITVEEEECHDRQPQARHPQQRNGHHRRR